jgi:hypothetical protein
MIKGLIMGALLVLALSAWTLEFIDDYKKANRRRKH